MVPDCIELRVVWSDMAGNSPLLGKFSSRLIEDSCAGIILDLRLI